MNPEKHPSGLSTGMRAIISALAVAALVGIVPFTALVLAFSTVHRGLFFKLLLLAAGGVCVLLAGWCARSRVTKRIGLAALALALAGAALAQAWFWWSEYRFPVVADSIDWQDYRPFAPGNKLVRVDALPEQRITGPLPEIDGAYAFYPVYAAAVQAICPPESACYATHGSDVTFTRLLADDTDLIFSLAPSKKQLQAAAEKGLAYDMTPFAREAIGFSFLYYSTGMTPNPEIKLLSIDGIAPTRENIANGTYPFISTCHIITACPRSANTRKFIAFILSPQGREIIEKTGYTPLSAPAGPQQSI